MNKQGIKMYPGRLGLGLAFGVCLSACLQIPQPLPPSSSPVPTPTPSSISSPTPTQTPAAPSALPTATAWPDPFELNPKVDTGGSKIEPFEAKFQNPKLKYPMDLAVSQDGETVYVLNRNTGSSDGAYVSRPERMWHEWFDFMTIYLPLIQQPSQDRSQSERWAGFFEGISQKFIYVLSKEALKPQVLTIQGKVPFPLTLGEDLETDAHNNLYFTEPINHRIYKYQPQTQELEIVTQVLHQQVGYVNNSGFYVNTIGFTALAQDTSEKYYYYLDGPIRLKVDTMGINYLTGRFWNVSETNSPDTKMEKFLFASKQPLKIKMPFDTNMLPLYVPLPENTVHISSEIFYDIFRGATVHKMYSEAVINSKGEIFGNDLRKNMIWKLNPTTQAHEPFAGSGEVGFKDGPATTAAFRYPMGLAVDGQDNLYVSDTGNHAIRKITPEGMVSTFYREEWPAAASQP